MKLTLRRVTDKTVGGLLPGLEDRLRHLVITGEQQTPTNLCGADSRYAVSTASWQFTSAAQGMVRTPSSVTMLMRWIWN